MIKGAKYAIRPLYDEETNVSKGWQIIEMLAEHPDSVYGTKVGELRGDLMNVRALAFVQFIITSWQEQEHASMAEEVGGYDDRREPAIEGDIIGPPDA